MCYSICHSCAGYVMKPFWWWIEICDKEIEWLIPMKMYWIARLLVDSMVLLIRHPRNEVRFFFFFWDSYNITTNLAIRTLAFLHLQALCAWEVLKFNPKPSQELALTIEIMFTGTGHKGSDAIATYSYHDEKHWN